MLGSSPHLWVNLLQPLSIASISESYPSRTHDQALSSIFCSQFYESGLKCSRQNNFRHRPSLPRCSGLSLLGQSSGADSTMVIIAGDQRAEVAPNPYHLDISAISASCSTQVACFRGGLGLMSSGHLLSLNTAVWS